MNSVLSELETGPWVGASPAMNAVLERVQRVARSPRTTVLVSGESGTGKELVARAVHEASRGGRRPFVAVNCAALADGLVEAELFGYAPGAFTGGRPGGHEGLIAAASGGTLLLDEIGELAAEPQAKLLRVLQERSFRRIGENRDRPADARIIASTHRDLSARVDAGLFREDLYYRLNVLSIHLPPLRERLEDIAPLARHFLARLGADLGRSFELSEAALDGLRRRPWPGNVRELANVLERAAVLSPHDRLDIDDLEPVPDAVPEAPSAREASVAALSLPLESLRLRDMESALIRRALEACEGNRSRAARELGINRATLYGKLRRLGIGA